MASLTLSPESSVAISVIFFVIFGINRRRGGLFSHLAFCHLTVCSLTAGKDSPLADESPGGKIQFLRSFDGLGRGGLREMYGGLVCFSFFTDNSEG